MRALLYTRVSHEDQVKFGMSLDAQLEELNTYCEANNLQIGGIYSDEGVSGGSIKKRESFQKMIEESQPGDIILFTKLDRFSRNLLDANITVKELDKKKVAIKAIKEDDIDTSTADGRFIFNLKLSLAEREREKTSERIKDVFKYKIMNGEVTNTSVPFGYKIVDKHVVIDTDKVELVREIFNRYEKIQNLQQLTVWWNKTYPEYAIEVANMRVRLKNTMYIGIHPSGYNDHFCEPIISLEQFNRIQDILKRNIKFRQNCGRVYLFTRLLVCEECGNRLGGSFSTKRSGEYREYRCMNHSRNNLCTNNRNISEKKIEAVLLADLMKQIGDVKVDLKLKTKKSSAGNLASKKNKLNDKIERIKNLYIDGVIDKKEFDFKYNELSTELNSLKSLESKSEVPKIVKDLHDVDFMELYSKLNAENKRAFWRKFVKEIKISKEGISEILYY